MSSARTVRTAKRDSNSCSSVRTEASGRDLDDSGVHLDDCPAHSCVCERLDTDVCPRCGGRSRDEHAAPSSGSRARSSSGTSSRIQQKYVSGGDGGGGSAFRTVFSPHSESLSSTEVFTVSVTSSEGGSMSSQSWFPTQGCQSLSDDTFGDCLSPVFSPIDSAPPQSSSVFQQRNWTTTVKHRAGADVLPDSGIALSTGGYTTTNVSSSVESASAADPESEADSFNVTIRSAPDSSVAVPVVMSVKKHSTGSDSRGRMRFKRFLEPLRRSHSAGNRKDVPAAENFLQEDISPPTVTVSSNTGLKLENSRYTTVRGPAAVDSPTDSARGDHKETKKKSLTSEVKERLSSIRRRCADLTTSTKDSKPTPDVVRLWSNSLETLLADRFGRQCFREFLKSEFSEENVEFWIACEEFKNMKTTNLAGPAQKIFSEFVAHQAPREINIDSITRELIYANMNNEPHRNMFEPAQKRIQALMDKDSYPRFLQSDLYLFLLSQSGSSSG